MADGQQVFDASERSDGTPLVPVLDVRGLRIIGGGDREIPGAKLDIGPIDLSVGPGEIVGIAAVSGNGQAELVEALAGLRSVSGGTIRLAGQEVTVLGPRARREAGLAYIPQDRRGRGTAPTRTVMQNAMAGHHRSQRLQRCGWLKFKEARRLTRDIVKKFNVRTAGLDVTGLTLSGGNLQKLVVGRELFTEPRLLIAEDPTQGVDIGSVEAIRGYLLEAAGNGCGILLVSQDLSEVIALSDRILVLYEGRIVGQRLPGAGVEQELGLLMTGAIES